MNREDADRDLLLVSVFTFLTICAWIFFELVKTTKTTTVDSSTQQLIQPLNPKLNVDILDVLEKKE